MIHVLCITFQVADMKNSVKNRSNASSSCAGHFIESHIDEAYEGDWVSSIQPSLRLEVDFSLSLMKAMLYNQIVLSHRYTWIWHIRGLEMNVQQVMELRWSLVCWRHQGSTSDIFLICWC